MRRPLALYSAVFLLATPVVAQTAAPRTPAATLMQLVAPDELQVMQARFMLTVSPLPGSAKAIPCAEKLTRERARSFFTRLYASSLTAEELTAAIAFYSSAEGKDVVRIQRENNARILRLASAGQQVGDENPHYPEPVAAAIARFQATSAGAKFFDPERNIEASPEAREGLKAINDAMLQTCLLTGGK